MSDTPNFVQYAKLRTSEIHFKNFRLNGFCLNDDNKLPLLIFDKRCHILVRRLCLFQLIETEEYKYTQN